MLSQDERKHLSNQLFSLARNLANESVTAEDPIKLGKKFANELLATVCGFDTDSESLRSPEDRAQEALERLETRLANKGIPGYPTGFSCLDENLYGLRPKALITLGGRPGEGKCLGVGTKVLLYNGMVKNVEDINGNDILMGPDSTPRKILSLSSGYGELYKVTPVKGDPYIVNSNHILSLRNTDTGNIWNPSIKEFLQSSERKRTRNKGWRTGVNFGKKELPIDPYFVGLWLGDGTASKTEITTADNEIKEYIYNFTDKLNLFTNVHCRNNCETININTRKKGSKNNLILNFLREFNLLNNKHIPYEYLTGSREQRLKLLAGIVDSDGSLSHNSYDIITKSNRLSEDIVFLSRSLGLASYSKKCKKSCQGKNGKFTGNYNRIMVSGDIDEVPVLLSRKKGSKRQLNKNVTNTGISVSSYGNGYYYGFELNEDGQFLLGDFTVTHNSSICSQLAYNVSKQNQKPTWVILFSVEQSDSELADRSLASISGVNSFKIVTGKGINDIEIEAVKRAIRKLRMARLFTYDVVNISVEEIEAVYNHVTDKVGRVGGIFVDHLQKMAPLKGAKEFESVSYNVRGLKNLAKRKDIFVFLSSQLNPGEKDARPTLGEYRYSREVEAESDQALALYRPSGQDAKANTFNVKLLCLKNRHGPGFWEQDLIYHRNATRFEEI